MTTGALTSGDGMIPAAVDVASGSAVFVHVLTEMEAVADSVESLLSTRLSGLSDAESRESVRLFEQLAARVQAQGSGKVVFHEVRTSLMGRSGLAA
ncbi:MAG: hypothetical protein U0Q15_06685 [Kineosporiaceae bacterium]